MKKARKRAKKAKNPKPKQVLRTEFRKLDKPINEAEFRRQPDQY